VNPQEQAAIKSIEAILTDTQKQALPTVLKQFSAFQPAGIPLEIADTVNLTSVQRLKIAALVEAARAADRKTMDAARESGDFESVREAMQESRKAVHEAALEVLTDVQKKTIGDFVAKHPMRGPGGPGGPGGQFGPPQGGPGGPGGPGGQQEGNGPPPPPGQ